MEEYKWPPSAIIALLQPCRSVVFTIHVSEGRSMRLLLTQEGSNIKSQKLPNSGTSLYK